MKSKSISNSHNNSNNNSINIETLNVHPVAFGKEDFSILDDNKVISYILNRPYKRTSQSQL